MRTLVLALGNPLLGDEAIGLHALQALALRDGLPASVELLDGGTAGLGLVPRVRSSKKLLVLDAIRAGKPPGTVMKLEGDALRGRALGKTSPHQLGLDDILSASRLGGGPSEVVVLGVEPEWIGLRVGLSPTVSAALERLVSEAARQLREWQEAEERL